MYSNVACQNADEECRQPMSLGIPDTVEAAERSQLVDDGNQATRELLEHGFDVVGPNACRGLIWAAEEGKTHVVRLLSKYGADLSTTTDAGTLAHLAASGCHVGILRLLRDNNIQFDQCPGESPDGWAPFHNAVKNAREEAVMFLLEQGADPGAKVENGWTALHCVAEQGC